MLNLPCIKKTLTINIQYVKSITFVPKIEKLKSHLNHCKT